MNEEVMQSMPENHPIKKAWLEYKLSPEFANAKRWARSVAISTDGGKEDRQFLVHPHLDGSLWAAFLRGARVASEIAAAL